MSKVVKTVVSVALPIIGTAIGGPVGGMIGGAIGGGIAGDGDIGSIVMGGVGGYASGSMGGSLLGNTAGTPLATVTGNAALQGPTMGSGIMGAVTGGGLRALTSGVTQAASSLPLLGGITSIGNQLMAQNTADAAREAAGIQSASLDKAIALQQPYTEAGVNALNRIDEINADRAGYVQNNPLYQSLAKDAEQRLLANQAAKGKVASGGTQAALQDQLLQLGSGLVQQDINQLQQTANAGQLATGSVANLTTQQGDVNAAGTIGSNNAYTSGYQNQINTLLALQNLNRAPSYSPTSTLYR